MSKNPDDLIQVGKTFLEDKSSDVRVAATNLMAQISREMGYENLYPHVENMKPAVIKMIE